MILVPAAKLQEVAGLVHSSLKISDDFTESEDRLLFKYWNASPRQREMTLAETTPTALIGIAANKHPVVMHCPSLIQRACIPTDKLASYPDATVGKMKEVAIAGFKGLNFNELHACEFFVQYPRD